MTNEFGNKEDIPEKATRDEEEEISEQTDMDTEETQPDEAEPVGIESVEDVVIEEMAITTVVPEVEEQVSMDEKPGVSDADRPVEISIGATHWRRTGFRILVMFYVIAVLVSGYFYWMRPVRTEQIDNAMEWWTEVAEAYKMPIPDEERYR